MPNNSKRITISRNLDDQIMNAGFNTTIQSNCEWFMNSRLDLSLPTTYRPRSISLEWHFNYHTNRKSWTCSASNLCPLVSFSLYKSVIYKCTLLIERNHEAMANVEFTVDIKDKYRVHVHSLINSNVNVLHLELHISIISKRKLCNTNYLDQ